MRSLLWMTFVVTWLLTDASAQRTGGPPAQPVPAHLQYGPVPGFTTAAHDVPAELTLPLGSIVPLCVEGLRPGETVRWQGHGSPGPEPHRFDLLCDRPGPLEVICELLPSRSLTVFRAEVALITPAMLAAEIHVSPERPIPLRADLSNEESVTIWKRWSIAPVVEVESSSSSGGQGTAPSRRLVITGASTPLLLAARPVLRNGLTPAAIRGLRGLLEWRIGGSRCGVGTVRQEFVRGRHAIEVGPPGHATKQELVAFDVAIEAAVAPGDWREGIPLSFEATTSPPGYEEHVVWLAATLYGEATPRLGRGRVFRTRFAHTFGLGPQGAGAWQWIGVQANATRLGQDQKILPPLQAGLARLDPDLRGRRDGMASGPLEQFDLLDLDGNGELDLVFHRAKAADVAWLLQDGGCFVPDSQNRTSAAGNVDRYRLLDLDADGRRDLITLSADPGEIGIHLGQPGGFPADPDLLLPTLPGADDLILTDLDGDTEMDFVLIDARGGTLTLHRSNQGLAEESFVVGSIPVQILPAAPLGLADRGVALVASDPNQVWLIEDEGGALQFTDVTSRFPGIAGLGDLAGAQLFDLDAAAPFGRSDLLIHTTDDLADQYTYTLYERRPGGNFQLRSVTPTDGTIAWTVPFDANGDGSTDLLAATFDGTTQGPRWQAFLGSAAGLAASGSAIDAQTVEEALQAVQTQTAPAAPVRKVTYLSTQETEPKNVQLVTPTSAFEDKIHEIANCFTALANKLLADGDPGNDACANKMWGVGFSLLVPVGHHGQHYYTADCMGDILGCTGFPNHYITLNSKFRNTPCDWGNEEFIQFVATLYHEGVHAGCNTLSDKVATENTIKFLDELRKDSIDSFRRFKADSVLGGKLDPNDYPNGAALDDLLRNEKTREKIYQMEVTGSEHPFERLAEEIQKSWGENFPPVPQPTDPCELGPESNEYDTLKAKYEQDFGVTLDCEVDWASQVAGKITVRITVNYCGTSLYNCYEFEQPPKQVEE